jgi:hypothetical protein
MKEKKKKRIDIIMFFFLQVPKDSISVTTTHEIKNYHP